MSVIIVYMYIDIYREPQGRIACVLIVTPSQNNVYLKKNNQFETLFFAS